MANVLKRLRNNHKKAIPETIQVHFTSVLTKEYLEELEQLLYFNPQQYRYEEDIIRIVDEMGMPKIVCEDEKLRIKIADNIETQNIYAFVRIENWEKLAGVILFLRQSLQRILILHVAVDEEYSMYGQYGSSLLAFQLIERVKSIASHIKGVQEIGFVYGRHSDRTMYLPVKKNDITNENRD